MSESFLKIFDETFKQQMSELTELERNIVLTNPYSQQEYVLTHRCNSSINTFICEDLANIKFHLKVIPCSCYNEVKKGLDILEKIQKDCQSNVVLEVLDSFEVIDDDLWYLIVVTPSLPAVTLLKLSEYIENSKKKISKDYSIAILLGLFDSLEEIHLQNIYLNCIYPNTVMICKGGGGVPIFTINDINFTLKLSPVSRHTLIGDKTQIENLYIDNGNDMWGISISIYSIIGDISIKLVPEMKSLLTQERAQKTPLLFNDPALENVFRALQKGERNIFNHNYIKVWRGICNLRSDLIEKCGIKELEALHSGLYFSNPMSKKLVIKMLLILGNAYYEVYEYLLKNELFIIFIEECLKFDWKGCADLLEALFKMIKRKPKDNAFKEKLGELGILGLVFTAISLDPHSHAFYDFVLDYMSENTLTLMQILYDTGVANRCLELAKRSPDDKRFIKDTMSHYGPHAPKFIEQVYNMEIFPVKLIIQAIIDIPYFHKLEKLESVLELTSTIIRKKGNNKDEFLDIIKHTLELITELLVLPHFIQGTHLTGKCSSHTLQDILPLAKNPYLYYCSSCATPLCSACCKSLHSTHNVYNLLYITPHSRCNCCEIHALPDINPLFFSLPNVQGRFTFIPSSGCNTTESYVNRFSGNSDMIITTIEPLVSEWSHVGQGIVAYYEVKINKAGKYENVIVGLLGAEVYYYGVNGNIIINNKIVCKGPRFGSYDTIGIGLLRNSKVFFTYNGLLSSYIFDCDANQEIKIFVAMYGDGCEIEIKLKKPFFQSIKFGTESFSSRSKTLIEDIFKILCNTLKKAKITKIVDMKQKFISLLRLIQREDLIKKLG